LAKNAIVHGVESEEERAALKKDTTGTIEISTFKTNKSVGFTIRDDGAGIKVNNIREKLVKTGGLSKEDIDAMSEEEVAMKIFSSGISTAERVNINAGRGVGLGAVKEKVESYNGTISVDFKENEYCAFTVTFYTDTK
jgi:two-component system chemotaxis sensor kinase CheA